MKLVSVCKDCGRTIDKDYIYCPWCGLSQIEQKVQNPDFDDVFSRIEEIQNKGCEIQINKIEKKLEALEKDLSSILTVTE